MVKISKSFICLALTIVLSGCAGKKINTQASIEKEIDAPEIITQARFNEILNITPPEGPVIPIAVYRFQDMTGQRKPNNSYASLSSAVTQGSEVILIKTLQDAGKGKWFQPVERVGLENLVKERQLIRSQRETYEKDQAKPLVPLIVAGVMIDGGIVGYDTDIGTGGIGARFLGIGADQQYRKDEITVMVRLISVNTGEILLSTGATKTIYSTGSNLNVMKFVDAGTKSVEFEAGSSINEPTTYAIRVAIEAAVVDMIKEGVKKKVWSYKKGKQK
jgi:curli production assembly/transport component CsgG